MLKSDSICLEQHMRAKLGQSPVTVDKHIQVKQV